MFLTIGDSTTFSHHVIKLLSHDFVVNVVINWKLSYGQVDADNLDETGYY